MTDRKIEGTINDTSRPLRPVSLKNHRQILRGDTHRASHSKTVPLLIAPWLDGVGVFSTDVEVAPELDEVP